MSYNSTPALAYIVEIVRAQNAAKVRGANPPAIPAR